MAKAGSKLANPHLGQRDSLADGLNFRTIVKPAFLLRDVEAFWPATQVKRREDIAKGLMPKIKIEAI